VAVKASLLHGVNLLFMRKSLRRKFDLAAWPGSTPPDIRRALPVKRRGLIAKSDRFQTPIRKLRADHQIK